MNSSQLRSAARKTEQLTGLYRAAKRGRLHKWTWNHFAFKAINKITRKALWK